MSDLKSTLMIQHYLPLSKHAVDIFPGFLPLIAMKESPLFLLDCYRADFFRTLYMCISGISANRPADSCNFRISK